MAFSVCEPECSMERCCRKCSSWALGLHDIDDIDVAADAADAADADAAADAAVADAGADAAVADAGAAVAEALADPPGPAVDVDPDLGLDIWAEIEGLSIDPAVLTPGATPIATPGATPIATPIASVLPSAVDSGAADDGAAPRAKCLVRAREEHLSLEVNFWRAKSARLEGQLADKERFHSSPGRVSSNLGPERL